MVIKVIGLTKYYGPKLGVQDLDFEVAEGEVFGFLGPNGAGKTTTIRLLLGLIRPTHGAGTVMNYDIVRDSVAIRGLVGFLPGEINIYENMTCEQLLTFMGRFRRKFDPTLMQALAQRLEIDLKLRVKGLSKGMKQKIGIIQAFMHDAPLLILDEPSSGLDPLMQLEFIELLQEQKAKGKTIFLSSHMLPEVERVCDRVGIVRAGKLVAVEEVEALKARRMRRMDVTFAEKVDPAIFARLPGVTVLSNDGTHLQLGVRREVSPLLKLLGDHEVVDMTFGTPDLEEVFLQYYEHHNHGAVEAGAQPEPVAPTNSGGSAESVGGGD